MLWCELFVLRFDWHVQSGGAGKVETEILKCCNEKARNQLARPRQQPEIGLYQRLVESARNRLAELELEYGIEKSKVDFIRSKLFGALRESYQERDRLRLLVQFRGGAHAPSHVVFSALAENGRLILEKKIEPQITLINIDNE